jgi:dolichol-phosphate mannosyltransferase
MANRTSPNAQHSNKHPDNEPMKSTLYIVVPVFNERENLPRLFKAFRELESTYCDLWLVTFVMIDDGSVDGTAQLAQDLAAGLHFTLLEHGVNRGPGYAFGTAFEYLAPLLRDEDWVLTMEGDNTSRHELVRQMFQRTGEGYQVILASAYMYGGTITNTSLLRTFLSSMANIFVKEGLGLRGLMTVSSFFRLHQATAIRKLQRYYGARIIEQHGFEGFVEILMKMTFVGVTLSEVPMVLDTSLRIGKSKMRILKTILGYFFLLMSMSRWRLCASQGASSTPLVATDIQE